MVIHQRLYMEARILERVPEAIKIREAGYKVPPITLKRDPKNPTKAI